MTALNLMLVTAERGTVGRSVGDHFSDVLNVLDFGADPTGVSGNTTAFQACVDAAFGTAAAPHGVTNSHLNKAIYIPSGNYHFGSAVVFSDVYGGYIFGDTSRTPNLRVTNNSQTLFQTNGMSFTTFENIALQGNSKTDSNILLDLDWDNGATPNGTGTVGLHSNNFFNVTPGVAQLGVRIANQGFDGANNTFNYVNVNTCGVGLKLVGASAFNQSMLNCQHSENADYGWWVVGGSIGIASGYQFARSGIGSGGADIRLDSADNIMMITGGRTESDVLIEISTGRVMLTGHQHNGYIAGGDIISFTGTDAIVELISAQCTPNTTGFSGNGNLYVMSLGQYDSNLNETRQDGTSASGGGTSSSMWANFTGTLHDMRWKQGVFADLIVTTPRVGMEANITDCNTTTFGATAAGGGSGKCRVRYNGSNWTVMSI